MWAKKVDKREFEKRGRENESRIEALPGRIEAANLSKYRNELRERQEKKWTLRKIMHSRRSGRGIAGKRQWRHVGHSITGKNLSAKNPSKISELIKDD